eukprot:TRINITY_DN61169_c0_g1_i1.p2 TRINITY_DN61169_c0_g1~~TRINITY_DN61169_c0_g1_i1.p2  ORF type:complete len:513 (+),score=209.69 TRINITY_DN61169_c0_g1_i1:65-1540(+)
MASGGAAAVGAEPERQRPPPAGEAAAPAAAPAAAAGAAHVDPGAPQQPAAGAGPLDLGEVDAFLKALETGNFAEEAAVRGPRKKVPLRDQLTPAAVLDPVLPEPGAADMLHTYEYKDGGARSPTPAPGENDAAQVEEIRRLSHKNVRLNDALAARLDRIVTMCEELDSDIAERREREQKLLEANGLFQRLLNTLLAQTRANAQARRGMAREWLRQGDASVGPLEDRLLQQRSEMRALQRDMLLVDQQVSSHEANVNVLRRELALLDPSTRDEDLDEMEFEAPQCEPPEAAGSPQAAGPPVGAGWALTPQPTAGLLAPAPAGRGWALTPQPNTLQPAGGGRGGGGGWRRRSVLFQEEPKEGERRCELTPRTLLRVRAAFDRVDAQCQCDGSVSREDLQGLFKDSWGDAERLLRELDSDGDGQVTLREWTAWFAQCQSASERERRLNWIQAHIASSAGDKPRAKASSRHPSADGGGQLPDLPSPPYASTTAHY